MGNDIAAAVNVGKNKIYNDEAAGNQLREMLIMIAGQIETTRKCVA
jgi:hypothetical protein